MAEIGVLTPSPDDRTVGFLASEQTFVHLAASVKMGSKPPLSVMQKFQSV